MGALSQNALSLRHFHANQTLGKAVARGLVLRQRQKAPRKLPQQLVMICFSSSLRFHFTITCHFVNVFKTLLHVEFVSLYKSFDNKETGGGTF